MAKQTRKVETEGAAPPPPPIEDRDHEPNGADGEPVQPGPPPSLTSDIFENLDNLRLPQGFNQAKIRKPFTTCAIRKPRRHEWFQSTPDPAFRFETSLFSLKEDMSADWYLPVGAEVLAELDAGSLFQCVIFPWITRKSEVSIWPVPLLDINGRDNDWWISMREVMTHHAARGQWVRISGGNQGYEVEIAENEALPPPKWPDVSLNVILRTAFKGGRVIDSLDHRIIQSLRGHI
jgi:hypothetical protein